MFYMPSRTDTAGHTKAFDYPVQEHWGGGTEVFSSASGISPILQQSIRLIKAHANNSYLEESTVKDCSQNLPLASLDVQLQKCYITMVTEHVEHLLCRQGLSLTTQFSESNLQILVLDGLS